MGPRKRGGRVTRAASSLVAASQAYVIWAPGCPPIGPPSCRMSFRFRIPGNRPRLGLDKVPPVNGTLSTRVREFGEEEADFALSCRANLNPERIRGARIRVRTLGSADSSQALRSCSGECKEELQPRVTDTCERETRPVDA